MKPLLFKCHYITISLQSINYIHHMLSFWNWILNFWKYYSFRLKSANSIIVMIIFEYHKKWKLVSKFFNGGFKKKHIRKLPAICIWTFSASSWLVLLREYSFQNFSPSKIIFTFNWRWKFLLKEFCHRQLNLGN